MKEKKKAVFVAFTTIGKVWKSYNGISEKAKITDVPLVAMINRWDGLIGFPGGEVEKGEKLIEAAKREVFEEIGYQMTSDEYSNAVVIFEKETKDQISYLVEISVSFENMKYILSEFKNAEHYLSEITSVMATPVINYSHCPSFDNFMKNNFAQTVSEQLIELIRFKKWFSRYGLEKYS